MDSAPPHRTVGLSEVRCAVQEGCPLLLLQELRAAEPGGPVLAGHADERAPGTARSQYAVGRRHRGALDARPVRGWTAAPLQYIREWIRLAGIPRAGGRDATRSPRPPEVDQVLWRRLDTRRRRILLQPLSGARPRRRSPAGREPRSEGLLPPARYRPSRRSSDLRAPRPA